MIGQSISHYRILEKLGERGMGEVYRAEDTTLKRDVAIKVLPERFTQDAERLARFQREAQLLASLNHPNVAAIHSFEHSDGVHFLAMELVEGETLAERVAKGPLPVEEALEVGRQIAEGLEAAHESGVIHRDLKPANVNITPEGKVKILDFGLAKALEGEIPAADISHSPTRTGEMTSAGVILGTAAYMSPEQARGQVMDKRTDIWAFGCVLYEVLTGRQVFGGTTVTDILGAIVHKDPDWEALPEGTPRAIQRLLRRCLEKDRNRRLRDIGDARIEMEDALSEPLVPSPSAKTTRWKLAPLWGTAAVLVLATLAYLTWRATSVGPLPSSSQPTHRQITFLGNVKQPAISRDGRSIAYFAGEDSQRKVLVQDISGGQTVEVFEIGLPGVTPSLRWSPDGSELLVTKPTRSEGGTFLIPRLGGTPRRIARFYRFVSWSPDGSRFASATPNKIFTPNEIFLTDKRTGEQTSIPLQGSFTLGLRAIDWSPEGAWIAFATIDDQESFTIWTIRHDGSQQQQVLEERDFVSMRWSPQGDAIYYLLSKGQTKELWKIPVSPDTGAPRGRQALLLSGLEAGVRDDALELTAFSVSGDGKRLLYSRQPGYSNLWVVTASRGEEEPSREARRLVAGTHSDTSPSISPDGTKIAFSRADGQTSNIFVMPIEGGPARQITFLESVNTNPAWSPDGKNIAFASREGDTPKVWRISANGGSPQQFSKSELRQRK